MRYLSAALLTSALLAGCGSSSAKPAPTPAPTAHSFARVSTIPATTPPPVKGRKGASAGAGRTTAARLPTVAPISPATPTPISSGAYTARIHGTVTNAKTGSPVAGALIAVGSDVHHTTRSDAFGRYSAAFPAGPAVPVTVQLNGYAGALAMGRLQGHRSVKVDFKLSPIVKGKPVAPPPPMVFGSP